MFCLTSAEDTQTDRTSLIVDNCILRLANNDLSAMEELYHRTKTSVYSFALSILKNAHDAEDVLHDCYVLVWGAAGSYRSAGKPMAWLLTITRNLCLKKLAENKKAVPLDTDAALAKIDTSMPAEDRMIISECFRSLSDEERQIVVLHAVSGFKHREIAQLLDMPVSTVLSKYNRALKKLRRILKGGE